MHTPQTPSPVRRSGPSVAHHSGTHPPAHPPTGHRPGPAPTGPTSERRSGGVAGRVSPLSRAVAAALHHLADLTGTEARAAFVARGRIDRMLREAVDHHAERGDRAGAGAAVRVACAYLLAGDTEDAYLALLTARDMLA